MPRVPTKPWPPEHEGEKLLRDRAQLHEAGCAVVDEILEILERLDTLWGRWERLHDADRLALSHLNKHELHRRRAIRTLTETTGLSGELRGKIADTLRRYRLVRGARMMAKRAETKKRLAETL
jgi:hypothetical protein